MIHQTNSKRTTRIYSMLVAGCLAGLTACADYSPDSYAPGDMQQVSKVDRAVINSVREVDVDDPSLGLGAAAGGVGRGGWCAGWGEHWRTGRE